MAKGIGKVIAGILIIVIGGTAYAVSQNDVVKNFSEETGMTQQEAQQYVENISEEELTSLGELGGVMLSKDKISSIQRQNWTVIITSMNGKLTRCPVRKD